MSFDAIISYCCGHHNTELRRKSRDIRREKVETAVKRLDAAIARSHEVGDALRTSYREAAEASKHTIECLECSPSAKERVRSKGQYEELP